MTNEQGAKILPGISDAIGALNEKIAKAAGNDRPVFITGEMGTERAVAARLIHQFSPRADKPLTKINVSWKLPPDISQYFERTNGGTLMIHLQKDFPVDMQYTLVEMANHGSFADPLSGELIEADTRIILITSVPKAKMLEGNPLLPELKDLLETQHLEIPPLRDRPEDIPALVRYAMRRARETGRSQAEVADPTLLALFRRWDWPGNAEDLLLVTAQAAIACTEEKVLSLHHLPEAFLAQLPAQMVEEVKELAEQELPEEDTEPRPQPRADDDTQKLDAERVRRALARVPEVLSGSTHDMPTPLPLDEHPPSGTPAPPGQAEAGDDSASGSDASRVLNLARRLKAQAALLNRQFTGPLGDERSDQELEHLMSRITDQEAMEALETEIHKGLDLVMTLRRQMAVLNVRQQQNAETIRDLLQRLQLGMGSSDMNPVADEEIRAETRELTESLRAIDEIVQRVSKEVPLFGSALQDMLRLEEGARDSQP